jgi:hypothetical protein
MPTPNPYAYVATPASSFTTPPGGPKVLAHTRQGKIAHLLRPAGQDPPGRSPASRPRGHVGDDLPAAVFQDTWQDRGKSPQ